MSHHMTLPTTSLISGLTGQATAAKRGLTAKDATSTTGTTSGTTSATSTSTAASSTSSLDTTFLSLLVQELQNQDPTAPMDSTAMVGQMISLNQLDQLTSINQTLGAAYPGSTTSTSSSTASGSTSGTSTDPTTSGTGAQAQALSATQAALRLLSANSTTMQPAVSPSVTLPAF